VTDDGDEVLVDARGHHCPVPTLRLRRALEAAGGQVVRLIADDPMARIDVPHFVREAGAELLEAYEAAGVLTFRVRKYQV
jgi:tRNA 2-thiouridine synthesizing protein A